MAIIYPVYGIGTQSQSNIKYGLLYNWYAVSDARNIANTNWHVPSNGDHSTLCLYLDPDATAFVNDVGDKIKETGAVYWTEENAANNTAKFNARGAGLRNLSGSGFSGLRDNTTFWQSTIADSLNSRVGQLGSASNIFRVEIVGGGTYYTYPNYMGCSVRLIRDSTGLTNGQTSTYTGNDGKVYPTICIGTQEWLAANLAETKYRTGATIPEVTNQSSWDALTTGALCAYSNNWDYVMYNTGAGQYAFKLGNQFLTAPTFSSGSISINPAYLSYYSSGTAKAGTSTTVTSSGTWTASILDDAYAIISSFTTTGSNGGSCTVTVTSNDLSQSLTATIQLTSGTATTYLSICIDGTSETCG